MIVFGRQGTTGVALESKPLRTGQYWFVNGFGHGLEHAEENILMERIKNLPVQKTEKSLGHESRMQFKLDLLLSHRRYHEFELGFTGRFHLRYQK